ncbi:MAG: hypothetical protein FD143_3335 [Ignavibacteria bacterium]|nr:MAG: hypothetical protein FD143_3335 [Ignavibacteria bacterium]
MWQTIKELSKELGIPERTMLRTAKDMVEKGEWEYRYRGGTNPVAKEYKRKKISNGLIK